MKPTFRNCHNATNFVLPRSEKEMFVNWTIPTVTDNSGEKVAVTVSPKISPPTVLKAGVNLITYTATDKNGNSASCKVFVNVQGRFAQVYFISLVLVLNWIITMRKT